MVSATTHVLLTLVLASGCCMWTTQVSAQGSWWSRKSTITRACKDEASWWCGVWAREGYCHPTSPHYNYMFQDCKKTCNVCGEACQDKDSRCRVWATLGNCHPSSPYYEMMVKGCEKSCKVCGEEEKWDGLKKRKLNQLRRGSLPRSIAHTSQHVASVVHPCDDLEELKRLPSFNDTDVNEVADHYPYTCLHRAAHVGRLDIVNLLLEKGADPNIRNRLKSTPLHEAAYYGHRDIVLRLLVAGARKDVGGQNWLLPADMARTKEIEDLIRVNDPWFPVCHTSDRQNIAMFLNGGWDVNKANDNGWTCLHIAAKSGNVEIAKLLLSHKADIELKTKATRKTPLILAAYNGNREVVELLLLSGASKDARDHRGRTAADIARDLGNDNIVALFGDAAVLCGDITLRHGGAHAQSDPLGLADLSTLKINGDWWHWVKIVKFTEITDLTLVEALKGNCIDPKWDNRPIPPYGIMNGGIFIDGSCQAVLKVCGKLQTDPVTLTMIPASIIVGHTKNLTLMCKVLDPSSYSLVKFMRISKVNPGGSSTELVNLIPGRRQQPIYVDDEFNRRSHGTGNLNKGQGDMYLKVTIPQPVKEDAGEYGCFISFLRNTEFGHSSITGSLHEMDFSSLLQEKGKLQAAVDSCTNSSSSTSSNSTHASLLANTHTSQSLQLSFSPNDVLENTSPNVNLTCDAGVPGAKISLVTLMQISKVMANGIDVPLVRMTPGSQQPTYLDLGDFRSRSHVTGDLRVSHPVYMQVQIRRPKAADTGLYRCSMGYNGINDVMSGHSYGYERLNVWSWESLLAEIDWLTMEIQRKCTSSS